MQDGSSRRVKHDCGDDRVLAVKRDGPKLTAWCFRCNEGGSHVIQEPIEVRIQRLAKQGRADELLRRLSAVPEGITDFAEWPPAARLWFARAGLHGGDAGRMGARYDPQAGRVVLPCGGGFWQARALSKGQLPKYLAPDVDKVYPTFGVAQRITLTEDILSAYKVGQVGEGWCMLGTSLPPELLARILRSGKAVNVWLDNDKGAINRGQVAARKVLKALRAAGVECRNICTEQDPKLTFYSIIKELVS